MKDRADTEVGRSEERLHDSCPGIKRASEERSEKRRARGRCLRMVKESLALVGITNKFNASAESRSSISAYDATPNANNGSNMRPNRSFEAVFLFFIYFSTFPSFSWRVGLYGKISSVHKYGIILSRW